MIAAALEGDDAGSVAGRTIGESRVDIATKPDVSTLIKMREDLDIYHIAYLMLFQMPYPARS
jgi:hypothetical protein